MGLPNKCLAQSNKIRTGAEATKKRWRCDPRIQPTKKDQTHEKAIYSYSSRDDDDQPGISPFVRSLRVALGPAERVLQRCRLLLQDIRAIRYFGNAGCLYDAESAVPLLRSIRNRITDIGRVERQLACGD
jgi:hypothetical protein